MKPLEGRTAPGFWIWGFIFLFLIHAFAILKFSEGPNSPPSWEKPAAFLYVAGDNETRQRIQELASLHDPTLFALPHPHSFSGAGWLNARREVLEFTNWLETPEALALSAEQLGSSLNDYVATNRPSEAQLFASLRAAQAPAMRIPDTPVLTQTIARVEGDLAPRKIVRQPPLPSVTNVDVLRATTVTISVNGDGLVESASVSGDSGSKEADQEALQAARVFEFEPLAVRDARARAAAAPVIGRLVFTWNVVAPPPGRGPAVSAR